MANRHYLYNLVLLVHFCGCTFGESFITANLKATQIINPPTPPSISYSASSFKLFNQESITPVSPIATTGTGLVFTISPALPAGLTINSSTGAITGSATEVTGLITYTITATDANGLTATTQISISTNPTFFVNTTADAADASPGDQICATAGNVCTLRAAIEEANSLNVHCKIVVPDGTYLFSNTQLSITTDLSIVGATRAGTILDGNNTKRILDSTGSILSLSNLTLQNGNGDDNSGVKRFGGAVRHVHAAGVMTLSNVAAVNNQTVFVGTSYGGGGIYFSGDSVIVDQSVFSGNQTRLSGAGSGSSGGAGIKMVTRIASISKSTFSTNTADTFGGAISVSASGNVSITDSTFTSNVSTGGAGSSGAVFVMASGANSYFARNLFDSNSGPYGGGLQIEWANGGTVENNTFYNNTANSIFGGGLYILNSGTAPYELINNTFVNNSAPWGGGFVCNGCDVRMANNIFVGSTGGNCASFGGGATSYGGNIEDANDCSMFNGSDLHNTNPLVVGGGPQNNGGLTFSILLQGGSPALNFGVLNKCPAIDQRDLIRAAGVCSSGSTQY